jgi:hypothetical protein
VLRGLVILVMGGGGLLVAKSQRHLVTLGSLIQGLMIDIQTRMTLVALHWHIAIGLFTTHK